MKAVIARRARLSRQEQGTGEHSGTVARFEPRTPPCKASRRDCGRSRNERRAEIWRARKIARPSCGLELVRSFGVRFRVAGCERRACARLLSSFQWFCRVPRSRTASAPERPGALLGDVGTEPGPLPQQEVHLRRLRKRLRHVGGELCDSMAHRNRGRQRADLLCPHALHEPHRAG